MHKSPDELVANICSPKATLIPVKMSVSHSLDFYEALKLVIADIKAEPGRELRSVVTSSRSIGEGHSLSEVRGFKPGLKDLYVTPIEELFDLGVPMVMASGNEGEKVPYIDELPAVIKDEKHPIINVGAVNWWGIRVPFSQYGDPQYTPNQLDVYAIGHEIRGQTKQDKVESDPKRLQGTSFGT